MEEVMKLCSSIVSHTAQQASINEANYVRNNDGEAKIFQISRTIGLIKPSKIDGGFLL